MRARFISVGVSTALACALVAACAAALVGCGSNAAGTTVISADNIAAAPTVTVTANSEVKTKPDKARIGVSVTTQGETATGVQNENAELVNKVLGALSTMGVPDKSVQTADTWLSPSYDYDSDIPSIEGYEMTTRLSVSDLDIDKVGDVLQACVAAGANGTDGIQYYASDYDAKYQEALATAVDEARVKAEALAKAGNVKLGGVYAMTEGYQNTTYRYAKEGATATASSEDVAMGIMPGEVSVEASVTVSFEIS